MVKKIIKAAPYILSEKDKSFYAIYHKMVEEVEDYAILMIDNNGTICNWNKGAEKIKGYREDEIIGQHFRVFYTQEDQAARDLKRSFKGQRIKKCSDHIAYTIHEIRKIIHRVSHDII